MTHDERYIKELAELGRVRMAARIERLIREQDTDQIHFPLPVTPFLLGMVGGPRHERNIITELKEAIRGKGKL